MIYLQNDIRLRAETTLREQLTQDISQLAALIDALTSVSVYLAVHRTQRKLHLLYGKLCAKDDRTRSRMTTSQK